MELSQLISLLISYSVFSMTIASVSILIREVLKLYKHDETIYMRMLSLMCLGIINIIVPSLISLLGIAFDPYYVIRLVSGYRLFTLLTCCIISITCIGRIIVYIFKKID